MNSFVQIKVKKNVPHFFYWLNFHLKLITILSEEPVTIFLLSFKIKRGGIFN